MKHIEIVAELTYNHLGNKDRALKMIDAAKAVGATCVKFELRNNPGYFKNHREVRDNKEQHEFTSAALQQVVAHCNHERIDWFASIHDISSLQKVLALKPRYIKIASREARLTPFIERVKELVNREYPVIISTGGLSFEQIKEVYKLMRGEDLTLLHTSCLYPCNTEHLNLNRIRKMKQEFSCNIGYSGHEEGIFASLYAVTLGVTYIERHFTLEDKDKQVTKGQNYFKDELCTLGPQAFRELVNGIRTFEQLQKQPVNDSVVAAEITRVNAYGILAWNGDVYIQ